MLATFAAGCFWGVEQAFLRVPSVKTLVGYAGGHVANPAYEQVCAGQTGHAEAVQVEYDPAVVKYEALLAVFWTCHDPTTRDRQGPDVGTQYRSVIFCHSGAQRELAEQSRREQEKKLGSGIVTEIREASSFFAAEEYHQKYFEKKKRVGACVGGCH